MGADAAKETVTSPHPRPGWAPDPLMVGIRSPDGLMVGLAPATLEFWVRFPNERNQAPPCVKVPGSSLVPQARGILPVAEEQSRTCGSQSGGIEDQPQCRGLCHSSSPSARSFSRSPSPPPPSFTQSPSPPRSLVRDGQTSPNRPRLVVSRSTCPPLSPSPHTNKLNSCIIGTAK